uniref:Uncharacterized protein n=1 Tax=Ditylenchus dipsaci TaxID=166011 RepID=A0A915D7F6_9BILA
MRKHIKKASRRQLPACDCGAHKQNLFGQFFLRRQCEGHKQCRNWGIFHSSQRQIERQAKERTDSQNTGHFKTSRRDGIQRFYPACVKQRTAIESILTSWQKPELSKKSGGLEQVVTVPEPWSPRRADVAC